jgi:thiamine-monophosphate kinase
MKTSVLETDCIAMLVTALKRSPDQLHGAHESDAELIRLPGNGQVLAVTTDTLVEEIETGLYAEPEQIGWMTVMANLSDLAAVGADPLGILLNLTLDPDDAAAFVPGFRRGVDAACQATGTAVLGGDMNFSANQQCGGTAIGLIPDGMALTRLGAGPGDVVFGSGPLGSGSAFAMQRLVLDVEGAFRPAARLKEGRLVRRFASCAMDTSDGLLAALDQLSGLNGVGFDLDLESHRLLDPVAKALAHEQGIPPWVMLAGPHGEFELVFTVPSDRTCAFLEAAYRIDWRPVRLGEVFQGDGVCFLEKGDRRPVDTAAIRSLGAEAASDVDAYLAELVRIGS